MKRFPELKDNAQRGSKPRCHLFTDGTRAEVAGRLTWLVKPFGSVSPTLCWTPAGFDNVDEVQLHKPNALVPDERSRALEDWWFAKRGGASPTWDLASECAIGNGHRNERGVLLVEAKAHRAELERESRGKPIDPDASCDSRKNHERIGKAIEEANEGWRALTGVQGWGLSRDACYQMANRLASAWKLASLGTPVVLVYLGFLNAIEMSDEGEPFSEHADWVDCVKMHAKGRVPEEAWDHSWRAQKGAPLLLRIMSVSQSLTAARFGARLGRRA